MNSREPMANGQEAAQGWERNPFRKVAPPWWGVQYTETLDARDRRAMVAKFTAEQCRAALEHVYPLQTTVRKALEARLRRLGAKGGGE